MDVSAGIQSSLAGRYASALFDLASEASAVSTVESDLGKLLAALNESDELNNLITNPQISRNQAGGAIGAIGEKLKVSGLTQNFLGVLAKNRRLADLPGMIRAFGAIAAAQRGEITASVSSAHPLSNEQLDALKTKLTAREGRTVKISTDVDPDLLGGLVVTIGSKRIDGSIRTRLNSLANAMKG